MKTRGVWIGVAVAVVVAVGVLALLGTAALMATRRQDEMARQEAIAQIEFDRFAVMEPERELPALTQFGPPAEPEPPDARQFTFLLQQLGQALATGDQAGVTSHLDVSRMTDETIRAGGFEQPDLRFLGFRRSVTQNVELNAAPAFLREGRLRSQRTEVRRVQWSADRQEALVTAVHRTEGSPAITVRWWCVEGHGDWKVYDFEDVAAGWRFTPALAFEAVPGLTQPPVVIGFAAAVPGGAAPAGPPRGAAPPFDAGSLQGLAVPETLRQALRGLYLDLYDGAMLLTETGLARLRDVNLPAALGARRELAEGTLLVRKGDPAAALARFDAADRLAPGIPLAHLARSEALVKLGRHDEALAAVRAYVREVLPDAAAFTAEGEVYAGLKQPADAAKAFRHALDEDPEAVAAFHGLRRALPADAKAELGERLARTRDPGGVFGAALAVARQEKDEAGAAALIAGLKRANPNDPRASAEEIRGLVEEKKFADATAVFRRALAGAREPGKRDHILDAYLRAMLGADRAVEAYAAVPNADAAKAFRAAAATLEWYPEPNTPQPHPNAERLRELIAAHRKRNADDPWLWYYEGTLLRLAKDYEKAEAAFAEGQTRLEERGGPEALRDKDVFRVRRVDCLYDAKQALKAYATIAPPATTFRQLAARYAGDADADGLAALVAAHQKRFAGDTVLLYWAGHVHFLKGEYPEAVAKFRAHGHAVPEPDSEHWMATNELVRSLIRLNDPNGARAALGNDGADLFGIPLRAAIAAAGGKVGELDQLLAEQSHNPGGLSVVYDDPDFARLIATDTFAGIRKKYPDPRPKPPAKSGM